MFNRLRIRLTLTAAGVTCMVVAVVAAGFTLYAGFRLIVSDVLASGLTALTFLILAVGLLMLLHHEEDEVVRQEVVASRSGVKGWAGLVGEVVGAFASGAIGQVVRRGPRRL